MFKMNLMYVALAAALTSTVAFADPGSYSLASGPKVIDIEKPNSAGVSHNLYREFNVDKKGVILNNSADTTYHHSWGSIAKNNNLNGGAASVILNEVISDKASTLAGFLEVTGQKADIIVANPNGITCSGCSFVNTNTAILTTGKVNLAANGAIDSYTVTKGTINVDSNGMNASNSYAVLLADAIKVNGTITAGNAFVSAGNFNLNEQTGVLTSAGKTANVVQKLITDNSIDISELGGIRANSITMVGNNAGFGVRNRGAIVANSTLAMSSNGSLHNEGSITSNGAMTQLASLGEMKNYGTISTKSPTLVYTQSKLVNGGSLTSTGQMIVNAAGNVQNYGTMNSDTALAVTTGSGLNTYTGSAMTSSGQLVVNAMGNVDNAGTLKGKSVSVNFAGNSLNVSGKAESEGALSISSVNKAGNGAISNSGKLIAGENMLLQTNGNLTQSASASAEAKGLLLANSNQFSNSGKMSGATLSLANNNTENKGSLTGSQVSIIASQSLVNEGTIKSTKDMILSTKSTGTVVNRGTVSAGGTLTMTANKVENGGYRCGWLNQKTCGAGTLAAGKLVLNSTQNYASDMGGTQNFKATEIKTVK